jgi:hypothetical protein
VVGFKCRIIYSAVELKIGGISDTDAVRFGLRLNSERKGFSEISGSHGGRYEDNRLLGWCTV